MSLSPEATSSLFQHPARKPLRCRCLCDSKITPHGVVTTLSGVGGIAGDADGKGNSARFNHARGIAVDSVGNIYVSDTYNNNIRKITQLGITTTLAGLSPFQTTGSTDGTGTEARFSAQLGGAVTNRNGDIYVVDTGNHTIRKVTPSGIVTTLAGSPGIQGSTDGIGNAANFDKP